MGTLRSAQKDNSSQSEAAKRRAELESKVAQSLVAEQATSVEAKRKKLHDEALELAEKAAQLEKQTLAPVLQAAEARLAPFRKTAARPTIYWCKRSDVATLRAADLHQRTRNLEPGEELAVPAAAPVEPAPKRKRSASPDQAAEVEHEAHAARVEQPHQQSAVAADDDLSDEPGDTLAVVFD